MDVQFRAIGGRLLTYMDECVVPNFGRLVVASSFHPSCSGQTRLPMSFGRGSGHSEAPMARESVSDEVFGRDRYRSLHWLSVRGRPLLCRLHLQKTSSRTIPALIVTVLWCRACPWDPPKLPSLNAPRLASCHACLLAPSWMKPLQPLALLLVLRLSVSPGPLHPICTIRGPPAPELRGSPVSLGLPQDAKE